MKPFLTSEQPSFWEIYFLHQNSPSMNFFCPKYDNVQSVMKREEKKLISSFHLSLGEIDFDHRRSQSMMSGVWELDVKHGQNFSCLWREAESNLGDKETGPTTKLNRI